jgi:uncharacterized protein YndB with AHSA1/START domain
MADGTVETIDGRYVLRYERRLAHPVARVWAALTEPAQLEAWLARAEIDLVTGGRVVLRWLNTDTEGNYAVACGTITRLEPPQLLEIDTDIHGLLRWHLRPDGDGCVLTFTSTVALAADWLPLVLAGWHAHLDFLTDALDGHAVDWRNWPRDHWDALHAGYVARLATRNA